MLTPEPNREQIIAALDAMSEQLAALRRLVAGAPADDPKLVERARATAARLRRARTVRP